MPEETDPRVTAKIAEIVQALDAPPYFYEARLPKEATPEQVERVRRSARAAGRQIQRRVRTVAGRVAGVNAVVVVVELADLTDAERHRHQEAMLEQEGAVMATGAGMPLPLIARRQGVSTAALLQPL